jgi:hypothetical protein
MKRPERFWKDLKPSDWRLLHYSEEQLPACKEWEIQRERALRGLPVFVQPDRYKSALRVRKGPDLEKLKQPFAELAKTIGKPGNGDSPQGEAWSFDPSVHTLSGHEDWCSLKIDWRHGDDYWVSVFKNWLRANAPSDRKIDPKLFVMAKATGAGSPIRKTEDDLRLLGAARLLDHHFNDWERASNHPGVFEYFCGRVEDERFWKRAAKWFRQTFYSE